MAALKFLLEKEFKHIVRNPIIPRLIVMMPVMIMLLLPFAANLEVHNISLAVVDNDRTVVSERLTNKIASSDYFHLVATPNSYDAALQGIDAGTTDVVLTIPEDFARDLALGKFNQPQIAANSVDAIKAAMGSQYLQSIITEFAISHSPTTIKPSIEISSQNRFNPYLNYKFFMVPALMVMLLTIMCGFLPALNVVQEKETGTIEQMNVTPVGKFTFILSKIIPYWIVGFIVLSICFLIAWAVYGLVAVGSYFTICFATLLFILACTGLGLIISSRSSTMQQSMFVVYFFVIIMVLLSGLFTPVESMPSWAQWIATCNPLTYFIRIMRGVYLKGSTIEDLWVELSVISGFVVLLNSWAVLSYHKRG